MRFFPHRSDEARQRQAEAEARRVATVEALRQGEIPPAVRRRLEDTGRHAFTSTLSASDALLMRQIGVRPLTHVTGSAVFTLGQWRRPTFEGDVADLRVWNHARSRALQRLRQAAEAAGANAVVDVRLSQQNLTWANVAMREYRAIGTAVRVEGKKRSPLGLTNLPAQDFWKLHTAGWWPCGVVSATTVYRVPRGHPVNVDTSEELVDSSRGMRRAAQRTIAEADWQVHVLRAQGLVGAVIEHGTWEGAGEEEVVAVKPGVRPDGEELEERSFLYCRFDLVGTAVTRYAPRRPSHIRPVLWLNTAGRAERLRATTMGGNGAEIET